MEQLVIATQISRMKVSIILFDELVKLISWEKLTTWEKIYLPEFIILWV